MEPAQKSSRACLPCRRLKRKCSRDIPTCSLCIRLNKTCNYPQHRRESGASNQGGSGLLERVTELEERLNLGAQQMLHGNSIAVGPEGKGEKHDKVADFPHAFFLDTEVFISVPNTSLTPRIAVPAEILQHTDPDPSAICDLYLARSHTWFPIVSRKRLHQDVLHFKENCDPTLALLIASMKLISSPMGDPAIEDISALHVLVTNYYNALEASPAISLRLLQAVILIALYELGHGIFPAAYFTIGRAARLSNFICSDVRDSTQLFKTADTWTMREEERRSWWAVFILERTINVGPNGLPMAIPEPSPRMLLPISDTRWDRGEIGPSEALFTRGFYSSSNIGPFSRLCQSAHILSKVQYHRSTRRSSTDRESTLTDALQLHSTLVALDNHIVQQWDAASSSGNWCHATDLAICCSARMMLYDMYGCNDPHAGALPWDRVALETEMQTASLDGLTQVVGHRVSHLARAVLAVDEDATDGISPLMIECLYTGACECKWFVKEGSTGTMSTTLQESTKALRALGTKWPVARKYLKLLESP